jgi:D-sedoheptulose 7-phosphate isomerase|tara:strand:- start:608 stop:1186 length:579 start_codon:yes stop_codon:yes gene_type:complete
MNKKDKKFLDKYFDNFGKLISFNSEVIKRKLINLKKIFIKAQKSGKKILIFGNGGSAAIASHFSVDLTKNAKIRCINYNEADLITCFSNDFGYERWIEMAIKFYADKGDILIVISSSGKSKNMINACLAGRGKKISKIITLTGHSQNNPVKKLGDINLWVNSKAYNYIENVHQFWLLSLVDLVIGKINYLPK